MSRSNKKAVESPSKRLRDVYFGLWSIDCEDYEDNFDGYYAYKMELLINYYKKILKNKR